MVEVAAQATPQLLIFGPQFATFPYLLQRIFSELLKYKLMRCSAQVNGTYGLPVLGCKNYTLSNSLVSGYYRPTLPVRPTRRNSRFLWPKSTCGFIEAWQVVTDQPSIAPILREVATQQIGERLCGPQCWTAVLAPAVPAICRGRTPRACELFPCRSFLPSRAFVFRPCTDSCPVVAFLFGSQAWF